MRSMMKGTVTRCIESLQKHLKALHSTQYPQKQQRAPSKLTKDISTMHLLCYGDADNIPDVQNATKLVIQLLNSKDNVLLQLIHNLNSLEFDAKKKVSDIINYIIRRSSKNKSYCYIQQQTQRNGYNPIIIALLNHYGKHMHSCLHSMAKRPELTDMLLHTIRIQPKDDVYSKRSNIIKCTTANVLTEHKKSDAHHSYDRDLVKELFILTQNESLTVSTNAFQTLYELLINGNKYYKRLYLMNNLEFVFGNINLLIQSGHFVIQKQFLLLLRDLLVKKGNHDIMMHYISSKENLVIIMSLMKKYKSSSISFDGYQIFKIFIANPDKEKRVNVTLWNNKRRLIEFLSSFHDDKRREEPEFQMEKKSVIECIANISLQNDRETKNTLKRT